MSFVHLHVHSEYSFLDGASTLDSLIKKAIELKFPAMAITDHNRLSGAIKFYEKAKTAGIKPIIGAEIEIEVGYHLTLLCKNNRGYSNLCRLITEAHLSNRGAAPSITRYVLNRLKTGLIALSGCHKGEIPTLLSVRNENKAREALHSYVDIFGSDFYIELSSYPLCPSLAGWRYLADFANDEGILTVATNNVHYSDADGYLIKELLNSIDQNIPINKLKGKRVTGQYLKSEEEMKELFKDLPGALFETCKVASRCTLELDLGKLRFPKYKVAKPDTSYSYLCKIAEEGIARKYNPITLQLRDRLKNELNTINELGFCDYFLAVWDIVGWAKSKGIRCQARGSAVDSLVVYALDISNVDPVRHDLLFERFMHSLRREPPDIDLDIDRERRDEVRDYVYYKYGHENVACVGTINTYMARGAIRDAGKALGIPKNAIEAACGGIHYLSVSDLLVKMGVLPELKVNTAYKKHNFRSFLELCAAIDGFPRHMSVHLGGLVIGDSNLSDTVPLQWSGGGEIISQYDKDDIAKLGIVKMDLLALPTITVIEDTIKNIRETSGIEIDINKIPRDDPNTFAALREGRAIGIFQLESPAQREMAGRLLPHSFKDIIISISLVRPGPLKSNMDKSYLSRRHGEEPLSYIHPGLIESTSETLGVILYQEQVLKIAHDLAGMSYAEADGFRRAMTHDRTEVEMNKMRTSFVSGALTAGIERDDAEKVFEKLAAFAAYGFCKGHAAAYAELAYQSLWLKYKYPAEFYAALISNQPMGYSTRYVSYCMMPIVWV